MTEIPHSDTLLLLFAELEKFEVVLATGAPSEISELEPRLTILEQRWHEEKECSETERVSAFLALATARGHLERVRGALTSAAEAYLSALTFLERASLDHPTRNRRASGLRMYLGLTRLSGKAPEDWSEAIEHFDECIEILQTQLDPDLATRWSLSAAWINRGDALIRLGAPDDLAESFRSNEQAIAILQEFPIEENPAFRIRLALAWMNRGEIRVLQSHHGGKNRGKDAFHSYGEALHLFDKEDSEKDAGTRRFLAVILTNLSRARLVLQEQGSFATEAVEESRRALRLIKEVESLSPEMATLSLTSRVTLCRALELGGDSRSYLEVTDIAEEGLTLAAKVRTAHGESAIGESLIGELFRCGADAYYRSGPRFLSEYLLEHLDPAVNPQCFADLASCQEVAVQILWRGIAEIQQDGFAGMETEAYEVRRDLLVQWQQLREQLASIRSIYFVL
jgi:tetratricopeptide (TPR) repeat protein